MPSSRTRTLILLTTFTALPLLAACEERVVSARGLGANQVTVEEPLYQAPEWEQAIMGDPKPRQRDIVQPPRP